MAELIGKDGSSLAMLIGRCRSCGITNAYPESSIDAMYVDIVVDDDA